jgi:cysteinyl-tRNA synthetase, unknown class
MSLTKAFSSRSALLFALILVAWATSSAPRPASAQAPGDGERSPARVLAAAKSWAYQLQKVDPDTLAASPYDMLVIDYSRDGKAARAWTPEEVDKIRVKPDGERRIVLAYLSIGEAQTYRYYWKWYWGWVFGVLSPRWLGSENPEWRGNYGVRYWHEGWQNIILGGENSYLDRIVKAGFDGVYLDGVDEYVDMVKEKRNARALMIAFVKAIAERARVLKPGFLVVPQNAEALLADASYRAAIDAIGKGDLLFGDDVSQQPNDPKSILSDVARLKLLTADRKPVFVVEYLGAPQEIERARRRLERYGFIPYFTDRALDSMRIGDVPAPDHATDKK